MTEESTNTDDQGLNVRKAQLKIQLDQLRFDFGCTLFCGALLGPLYAQMVAGIAAAKAAGVIRDENHCKELGGNAPALADILRPFLPPGVPEVVAGISAIGCINCACGDVF